MIPETLGFAKMGIVPGGARRNRDYRIASIIGADKAEPAFLDILFDPQTSGGLLMAVNQKDSKALCDRLIDKGLEHTAVIGEFVSEHKGRIQI